MLTRQKKGFLALCTVIALMMTSVSGVFAAPKKNEPPKPPAPPAKPAPHQEIVVEQVLKVKIKGFKDIEETHWAFNAINNLCNRGIIVGYEDNTFRPNELVTRSQFAVMLANTLKLTTNSKTQTFKDVPVNSWDYKAVEAAKSYLTGYKNSKGELYFNGSNSAVREDMAVALVKALDLKVLSNDEELEEIFEDYGSISKNLRDFVYTAYKEQIMIGSNGKFNPQGALTRAEAAALLNNVINKMEKIVVDDEINGEKVVVDDASSDATLKSIKYDNISIKDFDKDNTYYVVELENGDKIPTVTAKANHPGAKVTVTQADEIPGYAKIVVKAEDGVTKEVYYVKFVVADDKDATLESIEYDGKKIKDFDKDTTSYVVELEDDEHIPTVSAVASSSKAKVTVTQATAIPGTAKVVVKAEDGTTKTYKIRFVVAD